MKKKHRFVYLKARATKQRYCRFIMQHRSRVRQFQIGSDCRIEQNNFFYAVHWHQIVKKYVV